MRSVTSAQRQRVLRAPRDQIGQAGLATRFPRPPGARRPGDPAVIVAGAERIGQVLGWKPRLNDLDTIVGHALAWEQRLASMHERARSLA